MSEASLTVVLHGGPADGAVMVVPNDREFIDVTQAPCMHAFWNHEAPDIPLIVYKHRYQISDDLSVDAPWVYRYLGQYT